MFEYGPNSEFWNMDQCLATNRTKIDRLWGQFVSNFPADDYDNFEEYEISIATSVVACIYADVESYDGSQIAVDEKDFDGISEMVNALIVQRILWGLERKGIVKSDKSGTSFTLTEEGNEIAKEIKEN